MCQRNDDTCRRQFGVLRSSIQMDDGGEIGLETEKSRDLFKGCSLLLRRHPNPKLSHSHSSSVHVPEGLVTRAHVGR